MDACVRPEDLPRYDRSGTRRRHIATIRAYLDVRPFDDPGRALIEAGGEVQVDIRLEYRSATPRPDVLRVIYRHSGGVERRRIRNDPAAGAE
jgi:hypothetical protein